MSLGGAQALILDLDLVVNQVSFVHKTTAINKKDGFITPFPSW